MASGHAHDKATKLWTLPFAVAISLVIDLPTGFFAGLAFAIGGLWLSPDLDTHSQALKRWGKLQVLWWPYRKIIVHRSFLSHSPIIGTIIRLLYLLLIAYLLLLILEIIGLLNPYTVITFISTLIQTNTKYALSIVLGLEASTWLHLIKDGDPFPKKWRLWKHHR